MISYFTLLLVFQTGWDKAIAAPLQKTDTLKSLSVIIPVRNEEATICTLLKEVIEQNYLKDHYEIIIVDDHSDDNTLQVIEETLQHHPFLKITITQSSLSGKKAALTQGISLAKGDIIVTTDADCHVKPDWLSSINQVFANTNCKMVAGPVAIDAVNTIFSKMQAIEFASVIGVSTSMMAYRKPIMCNGANLAFCKNVFDEVKGYEGNSHIASGDDEFLMRKILKAYPKGVVFNSNPASIVRTSGQPTLKSFLHQRIRWAGKWKHNSSWLSKVMALYIIVFLLVVIAIPVMFLTGKIDYEITLLLILGKAFLEWQFISRVTDWLGVRWHWLSFILLQLVYSFYAVGVGIISNFMKAEWKGRPVL
jgi:biofilm PGA synthesis N-glycosyltransferase PgaC